MFDFTGKVAVVTGGEQGIGRATALALARQGASVVIGGLDDVSGNEVASECGEKGSYFHVDVTRADEVRELSRHVVERFGRVSVLVNNAGIHAIGNAVETDEEQWRRVLDVNVTGIFLVTKAILPQMIEGGGGVVVNVASEAGLLKQLETSRPANRLGAPDESAAAIVALASDDIGYATGAVFSVDGGLTAQ